MLYPGIIIVMEAKMSSSTSEKVPSYHPPHKVTAFMSRKTATTRDIARFQRSTIFLVPCKFKYDPVGLPTSIPWAALLKERDASSRDVLLRLFKKRSSQYRSGLAAAIPTRPGLFSTVKATMTSLPSTTALDATKIPGSLNVDSTSNKRKFHFFTEAGASLSISLDRPEFLAPLLSRTTTRPMIAQCLSRMNEDSSIGSEDFPSTAPGATTDSPTNQPSLVLSISELLSHVTDQSFVNGFSSRDRSILRTQV